MNPFLHFVLVALAGGVGATLRHAAGQWVTRFFAPPAGTEIVNLTGSFVLGLVTGAAMNSSWAVIISIGLLGGYTTFSSASVETIELIENRRYRRAALHSVGTLVACTALALLGVWLTGGF